MIEERIVFIEYTYYNGRGNCDRELMKRLAEKGYNVHAITCPFTEQFKDEEQELKDLGVKFHFVTFNKLGFVIASIIEIYKIIRKNKAILYVPSRRLIPFYYPIKKIFKIPIIFSLQGGALRELETMSEFEKIRNNKLLYKFKKMIIRFLEHCSAKIADKVVVISKVIRDELMQLNIPGEKISLIYYAVDANPFKRDREKKRQIRNQYGIKDEEIVINYTARLSKKVPTRMWSAEMLIETIANVNHTNIKIMFVGGGDGVEDLKEISKKYGIEDKFIFAGFVPNHEVSDFLSASDIFWFVMRDPLPTYGLALLEAMSCENIVITNNSGSMKEVVTNGVNGFLVEPEIEQIKRKLRDIIALKEDELNRIKQRARRDVEEKYCWEVIVPKIERIILETIK